MKRFLVRILAGLALVIVGLVTFVTFQFHSLSNRLHATPNFSISEEVRQADPDLGHRIYAVRAGCIDCHGENLTGAVVMENGAMGSIHGVNITPSTLHDWTDEEIATAIRYGIHREGRSLRFMPSFDFVGLSKDDVAALIAYIRSVPPVDTTPHPNTYGPVARMLSAFDKMPVMFPAENIDPTQGFAEKPMEGPTAAFGQYLAASCIGCHGSDYTGGKIPGGDPSWPAASNIRLGADPMWSEESFVQMIRTGVSPLTGETLQPPMPIHLLQQLTQDETIALWKYLKTLN